MAKDGWRIRLTGDFTKAKKGKNPEGFANMKVFEIKSPKRETTTHEKNIKNALRKAEKDGKTKIVTLYMGKETDGKVHRRHVDKAIKLYNSKNKYRFEKIVVVDSKGNTYYRNHE